MKQSARLANYVQMVEDFLANRSTPQAFSETFFRTFKEDAGGWDTRIFEALNWVATACECYVPGAPTSEFDVTEKQLRTQCAERLKELRRFL